MPRWLILAVAVVGLAGAAAVEGVFSNRWGETEDVRQAAAKLDGVPATFGDWTSEEVPQDPKVLRVAEAVGHVSRIYTNGKTGERMSVLLLCGRPGPIGAHTPEVCYAGSGYTAAGAPQKKVVPAVGGEPAAYWTVVFEKTNEPPQRVNWAWGVDGNWYASERPRSEFPLCSSLYKFYVVRSEPRTRAGVAAGAKADPVQDFLTEFLPEVKKALAAPPAGPQ